MVNALEKGLLRATAARFAFKGRRQPGAAERIIMTADQMQKLGKDSMDMAMASFGSWSKNAQAIATEIADYAKKSFEESTAVWEKLLAAKTPEKAMEVQ